MAELQETTVVLADDHNIVREGIAALCAREGLRVLGQCSNGADAVEMITSLQPDFALLDMNMPLLTGVEVIRRLRGAGCTTKLLILSISRQDATIAESIRAACFSLAPMVITALADTSGHNKGSYHYAAATPSKMFSVVPMFGLGTWLQLDPL